MFSSCSVDGTVRVWDCRAVHSKACMITVPAHESDVNVIHWNPSAPYIVSGGDDGILKVWDLRLMQRYGTSYIGLIIVYYTCVLWYTCILYWVNIMLWYIIYWGNQ